MARHKVFWSASGIVGAFVLIAQIAACGQRGPRIRTLTEQEMVDMMQGSSI